MFLSREVCLNLAAATEESNILAFREGGIYLVFDLFANRVGPHSRRNPIRRQIKTKGLCVCMGWPAPGEGYKQIYYGCASLIPRIVNLMLG